MLRALLRREGTHASRFRLRTRRSVGLSFSKLWIYTNYDCNLRCCYCLAESAPGAPRRAIGLDAVRRLVDG